MVSRSHVCCGRGQGPSCCHGAFQGMDASNTMLLDVAKGCWADGHHAGGFGMPPFHTRGVWSPHCQHHSCSSQLSMCLPAWPCSPVPGQALLSTLSQALGQRCHFICPSASGGTRRVQTCCWPSRCWIPWLAPRRQDSHHLEICSIPNPSIPCLVPPSLAGLIPPWGLHPHQLFPGRSLQAHSDLGAPSSDRALAKCPASQRAQHLTAAPVCPGAAPTLLPGLSTEDTHPVCPARSTTQKTPTLPLLPGHSTLMHPPCPSCSQVSFGMYYRAAP